MLAKSMLTRFVLVVLATTLSKGEYLGASCTNKEDGYHWMKLLEDTTDTKYPPVHVLCNNEYIMIDVDHDTNMKEYFTSFDMYHYALAGPSTMDFSNWEEWWEPSYQSMQLQESDDDSSFKFTISPDCMTCDEQNNADSIQKYASLKNADKFGDRTGYYMTGTMFGCIHTHKAFRDCSWDWDSYECGFCTELNSEEDLGYYYMSASATDELTDYQSQYLATPDWKTMQIGLCGVYPQSSYTDAVPQTRDECVAFRANIKPSIGTDGRHCVCTKPTSTYDDTEWLISDSDLKGYIDAFESEETTDNQELGSADDVYELKQTDFMSGTYRITKPGTYTVMEDIEFDFNSGDWEDPNGGFAWWPKPEQSDEYNGAYTTRDEYFMGFFAGIAIEVNDVTIDLNGFEIRQSKAFYYQQRHFTCIALKSVVFSLDQGPGMFGAQPKFASNVVIRNGKIGLSSHFGIHGQNNNNVLIENVHVHSFETHGIEMTYFSDLVVRNVEIGPSSNIAYLKGEYAYARFTLQRLERIRENKNGYTDLSEFPLQFTGKEEMSFDAIVDRLHTLMDIAFKSVMGVQEYDSDDSDYQEAHELFINDNGIPYGAVMYGLFLNLYFANVFIIHPSLRHSHGAVIENVEIHDLVHKTQEYVRLDKYLVAPYKNPYNSAFNAESILGDQIEGGYDEMDWSNTYYIGDALIDAHIALDLATSDWGEKGFSIVGKDFADWTQGKYQWIDDVETRPWLGCNGDRMMHLNKGVIGIRMDGVEEVEFDNLRIHNLYEKSAVGKDYCGEYWDTNDQTSTASSSARQFHGGAHFLENPPYAYGFTGNMAHGVFSDFSAFTLTNKIEINDIYSDTGLVRGFGLYTNSDVKVLDSNDNTLISIYNLGAGVTLYAKETGNFGYPYASSEAKPFHVITEYTTNDHTFSSSIVTESGESFEMECTCIFGRDGKSIDDAQTFANVVLSNSDCDKNKFKKMDSSESSVSSYVVWSLIIISAITAMILSYYLCQKCLRFNKNVETEYTKLSRSDIENYGASF